MTPFRISESEALSTKGYLYFIEGGKESASSALDVSKKYSIHLKLPRQLMHTECFIDIFDENEAKKLTTLSLTWYDTAGAYDVYRTSLDVSSLGAGLYFFQIRLNTPFGVFYARLECGELVFSKKLQKKLQLSVSSFAYSEPSDSYGGIIYHVFVDRFAKGKKTPLSKNAVAVEDWSAQIPEYPKYAGAPLKNNYFYGGSLYGVIDKLDYLKSLGVTLIYLSPIFTSPSNHKYDTADYMSVDEGFGGEAALKLLIKKAQEHGIGIILDGVFNHTGADSIYFNKYGSYPTLGAYQSMDSEYYSWYDFKSYPDDYTSWWGIEILPRINPDKKMCRDYFVGSGGVIEKYSRLGIKGFRLDVVDELSDDFCEKIKEKLDESNKKSILYGEVWEDASNKIAYGKRKFYYQGKELDGVMNYPIRRGIISFLRNGDCTELYYALTDIINNAPKRIRDMQMNLIGTHDTERIITVLAGESSSGKTNDYLARKKMSKEEYEHGIRLVKLAYTILATIPGLPSIFYGDEAGLEGYSDPFNRLAYPWGNECDNLISHYRKIGKIRRENEVYKCGDFKLLHLDGELLVFERHDATSSYVTVVNRKNCEKRITFSQNATDLITKKRVGTAVLEPFSSTVYKIKRGAYINI